MLIAQGQAEWMCAQQARIRRVGELRGVRCTEHGVAAWKPWQLQSNTKATLVPLPPPPPAALRVETPFTMTCKWEADIQMGDEPEVFDDN